MKIIYDSEKPRHEKVIVEGWFEEGKELPVGCFDIQIEFSLDERPHSALHVSRWGNIKARKIVHAEIARQRVMAKLDTPCT